MSKHTRLFILLLILYIGLGLPDSLLSTTWPSISQELDISIGFISIFSMIAIFSSMISSTYTYALNKLFGPTRVILMSMMFCLIGLIIFITFKSFASLIVVQIIMGLGAGAIDSNVNFIASQNLKVGEMNLLHGFWGVGITLTPLITAIVYRLGYNQWMVFTILALLFIILISYGYINRSLLNIEIIAESESKEKVKLKKRDMLGIGIYFFYGVEFLIGTFLATYLVTVVNVDEASAAFVVSCYWGGLMVSRLIMPILFKYIDTSKLLKIHCLLLLVCSVLINIDNFLVLTITYIIIGYCFGPIFPTFVHYTERVNKENTAFYIGKQISTMYLSIFLSQVTVGYFAVRNGLGFYTALVSIIIVILTILIFSYLHTFKKEIA
ncbi:MFS transporter [Mollicutes bacterium LVI A0039]|nr:MFS transporter [Mollicutes bacterium LVI A0039]